ncbi:hypothetical protein GEMRC1_013922 [Eukaryota sp. GEM-RC1]
MFNQDPRSFHFIDAPSSDLLQSSVELLSSFECISPNQEVTPVGRFFFDLPLDVRMSYFVYLCAKEGYLKQAADLAALLTAPGSIFSHSQSSSEEREEIRLTRQEEASKTLPVCFEDQICQFVSPTNYDIFLLKSGLKAKIDRGSCFSSVVPSVTFALAYSIVHFDGATIVQQLHPLPEEFLPKSLLDKVYEHSIVKVTRSIRDNIGPFFLGALRRSLNNRLYTEPKSSFWHFVDVLYDDATLKLSTSKQVEQSVVDWAKNVVSDEF